MRVVANQTPASNNGTLHHVLNIFGNIVAEANGATGATLREMIYLEGMPLAAIDAAAAPKKIYAVHVDHLNRPIMLTDAAKGERLGCELRASGLRKSPYPCTDPAATGLRRVRTSLA